MSGIVNVEPIIATPDATPITVATYEVPQDRATAGYVEVIAVSPDGANKAYWKWDFLIWREGDETTIVGQALGPTIKKTVGAALWDTFLSVDANGNLIHQVKGVNDVDITWYTELNAKSLAAPS